jgi:hypothetical protein
MRLESAVLYIENGMATPMAFSRFSADRTSTARVWFHDTDGLCQHPSRDAAGLRDHDRQSPAKAGRKVACVSGRQLLLDERMQDFWPPQVPVPVVSPFGKV